MTRRTPVPPLVAIVATVLSALSLVIAAPAPATAGATAPGTTAAVQQAGTAAFLAALRANTRDLSLVVLGDSTGDEPYEWVRLTATHLASVFPRHTLLYYAWDKRTAKWRPAETVRRGTGGRTLRLWNGSVSGKSTHYPLPRLVRQVQGPRPDLVLLSFGHNEGVRSGAGADADRWGGQYTALVESVALLAPAATITHVLQNPRFVAGEESLQARRQAVYANLARGRGQGTIDAHRPFLANPRWTTEWMRDPIHPNEAGHAAAWAPAVAAALTPGTAGTSEPPVRSTLAAPLRQYVANGAFAQQPRGTRVPARWTAHAGVKLARERTYLDARTGGIRLTGRAGGRVSQSLSATLKGRTVTVAARVWISPQAANGSGRIAISDAGGLTTSSATIADCRGAFVWVALTHTVRAGAVNPVLHVYGTTPDQFGTPAGAFVVVDRVSVAEGRYVRDTPAR